VIGELRALKSPEDQRFLLGRAGPFRQPGADDERRDERGLLIEVQIGEHFMAPQRA
jgi:hypothetical protein